MTGTTVPRGLFTVPPPSARGATVHGARSARFGFVSQQTSHSDLYFSLTGVHSCISISVGSCSVFANTAVPREWEWTVTDALFVCLFQNSSP